MLIGLLILQELNEHLQQEHLLDSGCQMEAAERGRGAEGRTRKDKDEVTS